MRQNPALTMLKKKTTMIQKERKKERYAMICT